jgi:S1-C subfamily serine protease
MWAWGALGIVCISTLGILLANNSPDPLQAAVIIEDRGGGHGSGVFISPTQILTASHVAEHVSDRTRVRGPDGDIYQILGARFGPADIAIIIVDRPLRVGVPLGISCGQIDRGDRLTYYGSPRTLEFIGPVDVTVLGGRLIAVVDDDPDEMDATILTDGEGEPGVSGSGLLDSSGRVVGVYTIAMPYTTFGGFVSLSYPAVCEFVTRELQPGANA